MNYGKRKLPRTQSPDDMSFLDIKDETVRRKFRNLNEKKRRDQFNMLVNELSTIVSTSDSRRLDKIGVLERAIEFLRHHTESQSSSDDKISYDWKPSFLSAEEFSYLMLEAMDCVTVSLDQFGRIHSISDNGESKLSISQASHVGRHLQDFLTGDCDVNNMMDLARKEPHKLVRVEGLLSYEEAKDSQKFRAVHIDCVFESEDDSNDGSPDSNEAFHCIIQCVTPTMCGEFFGPPDVSFKVRHSLEWKVLHVESKAAAILGYQPFEILGTCGYDYCHPEDVDLISTAHRKLLQSGCCRTPFYRMLTKSQGWVWIHSEFYLCFNQWTGKPEHVAGCHKVARREDICSFKKNGFMIEDGLEQNLSSPLSDATPVSQPQRIPVACSHIFSSQLANIGISQNREINFGRQLPERLIEAAASQHSEASSSQKVGVPLHLSHAQQRLHAQLLVKYHNLKALMNQQLVDLDKLLGQLTVVSEAKDSNKAA